MGPGVALVVDDGVGVGVDDGAVDAACLATRRAASPSIWLRTVMVMTVGRTLAAIETARLREGRFEF